MRHLIAALALALVGCATPCPAPETGPSNARYECDDGSSLVVTTRYGPDSADVLQEGYTELRLAGRMSGSGYRYGGDGAELRVQGPVVRWLRPGAAETLCRAQP